MPRSTDRAVSWQAWTGLVLAALSTTAFLLVRLDVDLPGGLPAEMAAVPLGLLACIALVGMSEAEGERSRMARLAALGAGLFILAAVVLVLSRPAVGPPLAALGEAPLPLVLTGLLALLAAVWLAIHRLAELAWPSPASRLVLAPLIVGALVPLVSGLATLLELLGLVAEDGIVNDPLEPVLWGAVALGFLAVVVVLAGLLARRRDG